MPTSPILLKQYRIYYADSKIVAFSVSANVSEEVEARLQLPGSGLARSDRTSGDQAWLANLFTLFERYRNIGRIGKLWIVRKRIKLHARSSDGKIEVVRFSSWRLPR